MGSSRRDRETRPRWEVWLLRKDSAGGRTASRPPVAGAPAPIARDGFPVGEFCLRRPASLLGHAPGRRKEPGHLGLRGLDRAGGLTSCAPRPPPFGHVDPRLRSVF